LKRWDSRPVVDAEVFIELENEAGATVSAEARTGKPKTSSVLQPD